MSICSEAISNLKNIKKDRASLDKMVADFNIAKGSSNREAIIEDLRAIFAHRSKLRLEINEAIPIEFEFVVENAKNPYAEALKEGGITDPDLIAERKDIKINLQEILTQDRKAYESAGCDIWADALPESIKELNLTHKQIEIIKARVELGEIPIVMPGRLAQLNGLMQAIKKLKPKFVKDGEEQTVSETYHWDYIDSLIEIMLEIAAKIYNGRKFRAIEIYQIAEKLDPLVKDNTNAMEQLIKAVTNLPEQAYIFTSSVSLQNELRTRKKDLATQISELAKIQDENRGLGVYFQFISEYLALQGRFTERTQQQSQKLKSLIPLDDFFRSNGTSSRFIDLSVSSDGYVPSGFWSSDGSRVNWGRNDGTASSYGGFRVSVRI